MDYFTAGLGGIGLFLLGMWLITEGLRLAAGESLEQLLARWTSSRVRGLASGTLLTALLQSSSAVTVAVIGFANAGLMQFERAVWVIFGSNLGTTFTAWLVALVGFSLKIDNFALPLVGIGALVRVFSPVARHRSFGMALAGFGILFLGIETLSGGFSALGDGVALDGRYNNVVLMVIIGTLLTAVMMSSAAVIVIALSALAAGFLTLQDAAAVVIGTNIGTTVTALIAAIGATSHAKRLASAHLLFNLLTGVVALAALSPFVALVIWLGDALGYADQPTMMLVLFHTLFNVLGIVLMTPLEPAMSRFLMTRFVERETRGVQLRYLDRNVAAVPDAAPAAICREFETLFSDYPQAVAGLPVATAARHAASVTRQQHLDAIGDFFVEVSRYPVSDQASAQMSMGWRIQHNLVYAEETLQRLNTLGNELQRMPDYEVTRDMLKPWFDDVATQLGNILAGTQGVLEFVELAPAYDKVKRALLHAALAGHISRASLDAGLQMCSLSRRLAEQWLRALGHLRAMQAETSVSPASASANSPIVAEAGPVQDNLAPDRPVEDGQPNSQDNSTPS